MTPGQIGYEAYALFTGGKTFDNRDMPQWKDLPDRIQAAWEAAGIAILMRNSDLRDRKNRVQNILWATADLLERKGFHAGSCAVDANNQVVDPHSEQADRFCVSGAARAVAFRGVDGEGSPEEADYLAAMDAFCKSVGTATVMEWADVPGRTTREAVEALKYAARNAAP